MFNEEGRFGSVEFLAKPLDENCKLFLVGRSELLAVSPTRMPEDSLEDLVSRSGFHTRQGVVIAITFRLLVIAAKFPGRER